MKTNPLFSLIAALTLCSSIMQAAPVGTAFTYQGRLTDASNPAQGIYDFRFAIYDAAESGARIGNVLTNSSVSVSNGLFSVTLDFGAGVFTGDARWLEIGVRRSSSADDFTTLDPRQPLTSSPHALYAASAGTAAIMPASGLTGTISSANIADGTISAPMLASNAVSHLSAPDGSPTSALVVDPDGLLGLGTSTPHAGLHIATGRKFLAPVLIAELVDGQGSWSNLAGTCSVAASGDLLAMTSYTEDSITLANVSDPAAPIWLWSVRDGSGVFTNLNGATSLAWSGSILAVAATLDDAVTLLDVSNPSAPIRRSVIRDGVGGFTELNGASALDLTSNLLAVVATSDNAVSLVNVQNPASPALVGLMKDGLNGFNDLAGANALARQGHLLAVTGAGDNAVTLVDIRQPSTPSLVATIRHGSGSFTNLRGPSSLAWSGNLLVIAAYTDNAVTLVDVRDPARPAWLTTLRDGEGGFDHLAGWCGLLFQGSTLWIAADSDSALTAVDISSPATPVLMAVLQDGRLGFNHLTQVRGLTASGSTLVAGASSAVTLLDGASPLQVGLVSDGWVGIGNSQPAAPLHVMGNVIVEDGSLTAGPISAGAVEATSVSADRFLGNGSMLTHLQASNINFTGDIILATDGGKVGISDPAPVAKLSVQMNAGTAFQSSFVPGLVVKDADYNSAARFVVQDSSGNPDFCVNNAGNVGLGTAIASAKLDVVGNTRIHTNLIVGGDLTVTGAGLGFFPRPAFDSGFFALAPREEVVLQHALGGNQNNYVVDLQFKSVEGSSAIGMNNRGMGGFHFVALDGSRMDGGVYWKHLTTDSITVHHLEASDYTDEVRVRIWIYK